MPIANIGDTIEYSFPNNHESEFHAGKTYRATVEHIFEDDRSYGVYASYGKDYISFDDCKIIKE